MGCENVCVLLDYEGGNEFYRDGLRRAKQPYRCCECGDAIPAGAQYHYAVGKDDGEVFTARTCAACAEVRTTFCCAGWLFGDLWEAIGEQLFREWNDMLAIDCLGKLKTDNAVAKMRAKYAEYREANVAREIARLRPIVDFLRRCEDRNQYENAAISAFDLADRLRRENERLQGIVDASDDRKRWSHD